MVHRWSSHPGGVHDIGLSFTCVVHAGGDMKITSLLVRIKPQEAALVSQTLAGIPGLELHGSTPDGGRLIVTIEDGEGYAVSDSILAVSTAPKVLGVTLAYEYTDEAVSAPELAAAFARSRREESRT